nr:hypothetical protein CFP56_70246 [Quercus suber]
MKFPNIPGLQIVMSVDSKPLKEMQHEEDADDDGKVTRYVESTTGKKFKIKVLFGRGFKFKDAVLCKVYMDGHEATSLILRGRKDSFVHQISGARARNASGQYFEQPFIFAKLKTDESSITSAHPKSYKDLGSVEVTLPHVSCEGEARFGPSMEYSHTLAGAIPEKSLKGDLQVEGLIARSPSPVPLEERNPTDLSLAEAHELIRQFQARHAQQKMAIKQEANAKKRIHIHIEGDDEDEIEVTAASSKRVRVVQASGVEVVDLTGD